MRKNDPRRMRYSIFATRYALVTFAVSGITGAAQAQTVQNVTEPEPSVTVTAIPNRSSTFDLAQPASVLQGNELRLRLQNSLGETLNSTPGVSSTYFGPNASRPIIRGLDGERIKLLRNGASVADVSALSYDHAVAIDPISIERIEVLRGPATVLYGGNAIGGVVNVVDSAVAQTPISGLRGQVDGSLGSNGAARSGAFKLDAGNGGLALHVDAYDRRTGDTRIPGLQRSAAERAASPAPFCGGEPQGRICNSSAAARGGTLGGAYTWARGYAGLSLGTARTQYGTVAEPDVRIAMRNDTFNAAGEVRELSPLLASVKWTLGHNRYRHVESDLGVEQTVFRQRNSEGRVELRHARVEALQAAWEGVIGLQANRNQFSALGAEAFIPVATTQAAALFAFEEAKFGAFTMQLGGRIESNRVASQGGGPIDVEPTSPTLGAPRFGMAQSRSFAPRSGSIGGVYRLTPTLGLASNLSLSERAPSNAELFANGPHAATGAYEIGNPNFAKERSRALDLGLRWQDGPNRASVGVFQNRFSNYITLARTLGQVRNGEGVINPTDTDGDGLDDATGTDATSTLREFRYVAVPAQFRGFEAQTSYRLLTAPGTLDVDFRADLTRATNLATGEPLPRIAPLRAGFGLTYAQSGFTIRIENQRAAAQNRVPAGETTTPGYSVWNASANYRFLAGNPADPVTINLFIRGNNLFNREVRYATSILREVAPAPGRNVQAGLRVDF